MVFATPDVRQGELPQTWRDHRFGVPPQRWRALTDKGFWVVGAGTGFGQAIAVALMLAGARVVLSGRRAAKLADTRKAASGLGADPRCGIELPCDVTEETQLAEAVVRMRALNIPLFGLVHCAALPAPAALQTPLRDMSRADWDRLMRTNVTAPWLTVRAAMPLMLDSGTARVILLTSEAGWAWTPTVGPYNVSKAALNNLGMSLAGEYAAEYPDADMQINILVPGEARSEMNQGSTDSPFTAVPMMLRLLTQPEGGPNGYLFHRDGRHLAFGHRGPYHRML
jgi:NAD(P)-dependent dehydrogenase (short-subunit alcohol dehydrogenase family)